MQRFTSIAALTALLLTAAACGDDSSSASDTTAGGDTTVAAETTAAPETTDGADVPTAIISLSPTATEMLFAIDAGDQEGAIRHGERAGAQCRIVAHGDGAGIERRAASIAVGAVDDQIAGLRLGQPAVAADQAGLRRPVAHRAGQAGHRVGAQGPAVDAGPPLQEREKPSCKCLEFRCGEGW